MYFSHLWMLCCGGWLIISEDLSGSVTFTVTVIIAQEIYAGKCENDTMY